ncbi:Motility protein A [compost metagenome]
MAILGHKIAAALVGTFLGLLLSYGLLQPIAASLESRKKDEERYLSVIREAVLVSLSGSPPSLALEIARNAVFSHSRPTSAELESILEGGAAPAQGAAAK